MLTPGQRLELDVEKPAAGGRMIARVDGQVVLVLGAIPGERVLARIERVERQLAFATTAEVVTPSPDRRDPHVDPLCGGCLYAHIAYPAQVRLKADIIQDAFGRLGRIALPPVDVGASPERGYRMRGRLYVRDGRIGFYREGSHALCDAAATRLLTDEAVRVANAFAGALQAEGVGVRSVEVSENIDGQQRALHVEAESKLRLSAGTLEALARSHALIGCSVRSGEREVVAMDPAVSDALAVLTSGRTATGHLRRRAGSFFQANRFLLPSLVAIVLDAIESGGEILDLYAGVGLFAVSLAAVGRPRITAVEGDGSSAADLAVNARQFPGAIKVVTESVEGYLARAGRGQAETVIVDPPRTGISRAAMQALAALGARRIVYVSCDPATMARDARRLLDAGYELEWVRGFDFFPNTPHVETVAVFATRGQVASEC